MRLGAQGTQPGGQHGMPGSLPYSPRRQRPPSYLGFSLKGKGKCPAPGTRQVNEPRS